MREIGTRCGHAARIGSWILAASLISWPAFAQDQYFINVNPIQLCPGGPPNCVMVSPPGSSQIGFTDPATQMDITRAILSQAGIDVHLGPLQMVPSPADTSQPPNTLQLFPGMVAGQISSPNFQSLSDQSDQDPNAIKNGGSPSPVPPLSPDPHMINLFFTQTFNPNGALAGSTYFGLGWIGNNGVAASQAIFGSQSPIFGTVGAVPDALAHELVHDLGLDHGTDNTPQDPTNLMSAVRNEPRIDGALAALGTGGGTGTAEQLNTQQIHNIIDPAHAGSSGAPMLTNSFLNPIPNVNTTVNSSDPILVARCVEHATCWTSAMPTPWSDTLSLANLQSLGLGTTQPFVAAQTSEFVTRLGATTITFDTTSGPMTEALSQFNGLASHSDPCNFCEIDTVGNFSIPSNATDAKISGTFGNGTVPNSAGVNLCLGAGIPCAPSPNDFSASFQGAGRPGESLLTLKLTAPTGVLFDPFLFSQLALPADTPGITVTPSFSGCGAFTGTTEDEACRVLSLTFAGNPFVLGDQIDYTIGFCLEVDTNCTPASNTTDLAGGTYTYEFSDGFGTTSLLELVNGMLSASSQRPDFAIPTSLDPTLFTPFFTGLPCVTQPDMAACPLLELAADPVEDLIFFQAPEPPSIAMLIGGLGFWFAFATRRRWLAGQGSRARRSDGMLDAPPYLRGFAADIRRTPGQTRGAAICDEAR
jgi:hypothetical protein